MECNVAWNVDVLVHTFMVGFKQQHLGREACTQVKHRGKCRLENICIKKHFLQCNATVVTHLVHVGCHMTACGLSHDCMWVVT